MFFFGSFLMGEKKHINKIPPKFPGQSRENFVYVFFSLCVFFAPNLTYQDHQTKFTVGNLLTICRGLSGPLGPKPRKSLKKVSNKSFRDLFETFSRLETLLRHFSDFFGVSGLEGPTNPCKWSTGSQSCYS